MKKAVTIAVLLVIIMGIGIRLAANHKALNAKNSTTGLGSAAVAVNVANVENIVIDDTLNLVGVLKAWKEIRIASEAQGKIVALYVEAGQSKTKGTTLAVIDDKLKQLSVQNTQMSVDKLKKDLERTENLFNGGAATQQQVDDVRNSYNNALIELGQNKKQLTEATITAPISGIITEKLTEAGAYVSIGTDIATIVDISRLKVKLNVAEANVYRLKVGDKAVITTDAYPNVTFEGRITFISAAGDATTHNYPVEVTMDNSKQHQLKAGTFVMARIVIHDNTRAQLYIPREALQGSTKDACIYVVKNGKAVKKDIVVGTSKGNLLQVLSGLTADDTVITTGQINLSDKKPVTIINN